MQDVRCNFGRDELVTMELRRMFEQRGFVRVKVSKFEDYALYLENKNFLQSDHIITFMDLSGRLMALKPDVTLSIVKNMPGQIPAVPEKLYYVDEVFRLSSESREYKVCNQIGVEVIGDTQGFGGVEVLDLALESLRAISPSFVLDISHLGFVSGLLAECGFGPRTGQQVMEAIYQKNVYDLGQVLQQAGAEGRQAADILTLCELHGDFRSVLQSAESLIRNGTMREAWEELRQVGEIIVQNGGNKHLNLDFSAVNDLDYYNGLIFRGYVEGIPKVVLTGGRYDNLMYKMGKKSGAIGFAVSLDELGAFPTVEKRCDFDLLIEYEPDSDYYALLKTIKELTAQGKRVRAERKGCDIAKAGFTCEKVRGFSGKSLTGEGASC